MAKQKRKPRKSWAVDKKRTSGFKNKSKPKRKLGEFSEPVKKKKWKRRTHKHKTETRRWSKDSRHKGTIKSVSWIIKNPYPEQSDFLELWADDIENDKSGFIKGLNKIYYRAKDEKKNTMLPFRCVVIVEQRDRRDKTQFHYQPYFMEPPAEKDNIWQFTYNTVRNHGEFIRREIRRRGFKDESYDQDKFRPWYVLTIRIELLYL